MSTVHVPAGWAKGRRRLYAGHGAQLVKLVGKQARRRKANPRPYYKGAYFSAVGGSGAAVGASMLFGKLTKKMAPENQFTAAALYLLANTLGVSSIPTSRRMQPVQAAYAAGAGFYHLVSAFWVATGLVPFEQALNIRPGASATGEELTSMDETAAAILNPLGLRKRVER